MLPFHSSSLFCHTCLCQIHIVIYFHSCISLRFLSFSLSASFAVPCAGVQIAYFIIIGTQFSMIVLSIALIIGIYRVSSFYFYNGLAPCHNLRCVWLRSYHFFFLLAFSFSLRIPFVRLLRLQLFSWLLFFICFVMPSIFNTTHIHSYIHTVVHVRFCVCVQQLV